MDKKTLLADYQALDVLDHVLGRVTHKLSNLIFPVLGFSELMMKMNKDESLMELIEHTYDYSTQLRAFNDFLGASDLLPMRPIDTPIKPYDYAFFNSYGDALTFLTETVPKMRLTDGLTSQHVQYDPGALEAVMTHIICNALEAGADASALEVSCEQYFLSDDLAIILNLRSGDYAKFTLSGPSTAASAQALKQAFYPLYTTKDIGHHKGMGLWHSYRLMRRMDGTILFYNAPPESTCVCLLLPLYSSERGG